MTALSLDDRRRISFREPLAKKVDKGPDRRGYKGAMSESTLRPLLARSYPQATFEIVPNAGHLLPLLAPKMIADAAVRILAENKQDG